MKILKIPKELIANRSDKNDHDRYAEQNLSRWKTIGKFWRKKSESDKKKEIEEALFYTLEKGATGYGLRKRKRNT
jgi:hypothetical protein